MSYSEEEIKKYLNILQSYKLYENITYSDDERFNYLILDFDDQLPIIKSNKLSCNNCDNTHFINDKGYKYCNKCGHSIGHILGYNDLSEIDRCNFHQKSIYKRKYYYQNKIEGVNTKFNLNLSSDEKY